MSETSIDKNNDRVAVRREAIPIYCKANQHLFIDPGIWPLLEKTLSNGLKILTGFLKTDQKIGLIGITQADILIADGLMNIADQINPYAQLNSVLMQTIKDGQESFFELSVIDQPYAVFVPTFENSYKTLGLKFKSISIKFPGNIEHITKSYLANSPSDELQGKSDLSVHLNIEVTGDLDMEHGSIMVSGVVSKAILVNVGSAIGDVTGDLFDTAKVIGFTLKAQRIHYERKR